MGFEHSFAPVNHLGSQAALVGGSVRQHRLAGDISNCEDVGLVGSSLFIGDNKAVFVQLDLGVLQAEIFGVRAASHRDQNLLECFLASRVQSDFHASESIDHLHNSGVEKHLVHDVVYVLGENFHQIAVGAGQQAVLHLHDGHF